MLPGVHVDDVEKIVTAPAQDQGSKPGGVRIDGWYLILATQAHFEHARTDPWEYRDRIASLNRASILQARPEHALGIPLFKSCETTAEDADQIAMTISIRIHWMAEASVEARFVPGLSERRTFWIDLGGSVEIRGRQDRYRHPAVSVQEE